MTFTEICLSERSQDLMCAELFLEGLIVVFGNHTLAVR